MIVEIKNGDAFNGTLCDMDSFMNIRTDGVNSGEELLGWTAILEMNECFLRRSSVKYIKLHKIVKEKAQEHYKEQQKTKEEHKKIRAGCVEGRTH